MTADDPRAELLEDRCHHRRDGLGDGPPDDGSGDVRVDVLVPTCDRPGALAVTLACLAGQRYRPMRVRVSDQGDVPASRSPEVRAVLRLLDLRGVPVEVVRHLPRRGMAEHRQSLLDACEAPYAWFVDDDVMTEPDLLDRLVGALRREGCGFVGSFVEAPSALRSGRPEDEPRPELRIEPWDGPVRPEETGPGTPAWERRHVHFAAFLHRLAARQGLPGPGRAELLYKVAWVGGCVLYDARLLREAGGFGFWPRLPARHVGEDVAAQVALAAVAGGAGLLPSGAWHMEVPTTLPARDVDAPHALAERMAARRSG